MESRWMHIYVAEFIEKQKIMTKYDRRATSKLLIYIPALRIYNIHARVYP